MRRQDPQAPPAPETLCRYVADEWRGEADPFRAWCKARLEFIKEHGYGTVLGDPLDVIGEHFRLKREAAS